MIRRREFMVLLWGAAAAWPVAARGQQAGRVRRIGVVTVNAADDPVGQLRHRRISWQHLRQLGWIEGQNIHIDYRWGVGAPERVGGVIQLAWRFLMFQKDSALAQWYPCANGGCARWHA